MPEDGGGVVVVVGLVVVVVTGAEVVVVAGAVVVVDAGAAVVVVFGGRIGFLASAGDAVRKGTINPIPRSSVIKGHRHVRADPYPDVVMAGSSTETAGNLRLPGGLPARRPTRWRCCSSPVTLRDRDR